MTMPGNFPDLRGNRHSVPDAAQSTNAFRFRRPNATRHPGSLVEGSLLCRIPSDTSFGVARLAGKRAVDSITLAANLFFYWRKEWRMHHRLRRSARRVRYGWMSNRLVRDMRISEYRLQDIAQQSPAPQDARFHCSDRYFQHFSHLFVCHSLEISENHRTAENFRNTAQSLLDRLLHFVCGGLLEWCPALVLDLQKCVSLHRFRVDRSLLPVMPPQPA